MPPRARATGARITSLIFEKTNEGEGLSALQAKHGITTIILRKFHILIMNIYNKHSPLCKTIKVVVIVLFSQFKSCSINFLKKSPNKAEYFFSNKY